MFCAVYIVSRNFRYKEVAADITFGTVERGLQKHRRKYIPPTPQDPSDFIRMLQNEENLKRYGTLTDDQFYSGSVECGNDRHIILVNNYVLGKIRTCDKISINIDGTFSIVPNIFYQLLIVLVIWKEKVRNAFSVNT